jgi:hypothetical protein
VTRLPGDYLDASSRRIEIALWHARHLDPLLADPQADIIALQAYFEGLFTTGDTAVELAANGLTTPFRQPSPHISDAILALRREQDQRVVELGQALAQWQRQAAVPNGGHDPVNVLEEAAHIRNTVIHQFYDKRQGVPPEWIYGVEHSQRPGVIRAGRIDFLAHAFAQSLGALGALLVTFPDELRNQRFEFQGDVAV